MEDRLCSRRDALSNTVAESHTGHFIFALIKIKENLSSFSSVSLATFRQESPPQGTADPEASSTGHSSQSSPGPGLCGRGAEVGDAVKTDQ